MVWFGSVWFGLRRQRERERRVDSNGNKSNSDVFSPCTKTDCLPNTIVGTDIGHAKLVDAMAGVLGPLCRINTTVL